MTATPPDPRIQAESKPEEQPEPARDDARILDLRRARQWRIGATQVAAPSTRRWRRAGRFDSEG